MMCLCSKHLHHMNRYGRILKRTRFDKNELIKRKGYYDMIIYDRNNKIIAKTKIDNDVLNRIKNINGVVPRKEKVFMSKQI